MKLIDNWKTELTRLWCIRVSIFWGAMIGLFAALPALQDTFASHPFLFVISSMLIAGSISGARMLKQPGTEE